MGKINYEDILNLISDPFVAVDDQLLITFINQKTEEITGKKLQEIIGRPIAEAIPHYEGSVFEQTIHKAIKEKKNQNIELQIDFFKGNQWFEVRIHPGDNGISIIIQKISQPRINAENILLQPQLLHAVNETVEELNNLMDELKSSNERTNALIQAMPDMMFVFNKDGVFLDYHSSDPTLLFLPPQEFLHQKASDIMPDYVAELNQDALDKVFATGQTHTYSYALEMGGSKMWFDARMVKMNDEKALSIVRNLTEQKKTEIRNQLLVSIIERSQDFIGVADENQQPLFINAAGRKLAGLSETQTLDGIKIEDFFMPEDLPFVAETILPAIQTDGRWAGEFRLRNFKTGKPHPVYYDLFRTDDPVTGKTINFSTITRDLSGIKKAEKLLHENEITFRALFEKGPIGVAFHKMIYNEQGEPVNYYFIDANESYKKLTGINPVGKMVTDAFPGIENDPFDWIGTFGKVAKEGTEIRLQQYLSFNNRWYDCVSYRYKPDHFLAAFLDITEQKLTEQKLRKSEEKYRSLFETMFEGVFYQNKDGVLIDANQSALDIFGVSRDQFLGRTEKHSQWKLFDANQQHLAPAKHPSIIALKTGTAILDFQLGIFNPKLQRIVWVLVNAIPQFSNGDSMPDQVFVTMTNISEIKESKEVLKRNNNFIKVVLDNLPIGVALYQYDDEKITYVNKKFQEILGWPIDEMNSIPELMQRGFPDLKDREALYNRFRTDLQSGNPERMKWENIVLTCADGSTRIVNLLDIPLLEQNTVVTTVLDITAQKLAEQSLRKNEQKYRLIFEKSPLGLFHFDQKGFITDCNNNLVKILETSKSELIGLNIKDLPDKRFYESAMQVFKGQPVVYEGIFTSANQKSTPVRMLCSPIFNDNTMLEGGVVLIENRTAHIQKEAFEKQVAIARESVKFKQNFLANMSHEIRTPLTGIIGMVEILGNTQLDNTQKEYLTILKDSGENLREIINQVLDFSKIEAGKVQLNPRNFVFENLLINARKLFGGFCSCKGLSFNYTIDSKIPETIKADNMRIAQIINNMISNAVKFTDTGSVNINAELIEQYPETGLLVIKVSITDTGIGIPADKLNKLFTPFGQIEENDTRNYEGSGLGLSICKELATLMGGQTGVDSMPGQGSTFWFTFRAWQADKDENDSLNTTTPEVSPQRVLNILLAEDKAVNQKVIKLILNALGHKVTIACNGKQALELFKPGDFDLILMDIQMPEMDGITATNELRKLHQNLPPIVGLSANAFEGDKEKYMQLGMDYYITKPVKTKDFEELIKTLL